MELACVDVDVTIRCVAPGMFRLVSEQRILGFVEWDGQMTNLDERRGFGEATSQHLVWGEVELTPTMIKAPSLELVRQALERVAVYFCD